jgi:hypothetical protein
MTKTAMIMEHALTLEQQTRMRQKAIENNGEDLEGER